MKLYLGSEEKGEGAVIHKSRYISVGGRFWPCTSNINEIYYPAASIRSSSVR